MRRSALPVVVVIASPGATAGVADVRVEVVKSKTLPNGPPRATTPN
jgi:hypothetical protein